MLENFKHLSKLLNETDNDVNEFLIIIGIVIVYFMSFKILMI